MRRVFLSYRRNDSQTVTSFIYQHLEDPAAFGPGSVFMDIDDIPDGVDFRDVIDEVVLRCEFFLHVIGPRWVTPRLMDANDWVRLEIEAALRRQIPVTPVLVDGATMPREDELPSSLHPLRFKNARTIRHGKHFRDDVLDMVKGLHRGQKWLADRAAASQVLVPPAPVSPPRQQGALAEAVPASPPPPPKPKPLAAGDRMEVPLPGGVSMPFSYIPKGTFLMGSPASEKDRGSDEQQHEVTLTKGFWMGIHPVTVGQFKRFIAENPKFKTEAETDGGGYWYKNGSWTKDPGCTWRTPGFVQTDDHPVVVISNNDALKFAEWASAVSKRAVRLPTEAEWEYAARGGTTTPYYFGGVLNGTQANCDGNNPYGTATTGPYLQRTTPVGDYATAFPHPWGLCDVAGNVWEWCADWYGSYPNDAVEDPVGSMSGSLRVFRGGSWCDFAGSCRAAFRLGYAPGSRSSNLGFRLAAGPSGH